MGVLFVWFFAILFFIFTSSVPPYLFLPILNISEINVQMAFLSARRSPPRPISCKCGSGGQAERSPSILLMQIFVDQAYFYQNLASSKQC